MGGAEPDPTAPDGRAARDEVALARRAASGDQAALRTVLELVAGRLRAMGWHLARDHHDAQDLCQEALLRVSAPAVLERYRGEGPLEAYLVRVGVRTMISALRAAPARDWRAVQLSGEPLEPGAAEAAGGGARARNTPSTVRAVPMQPALRSAMASLPERARMIVLLISVGGYSYEETAEVVGVEVGTVKSAYSRARATLRAALAEPSS